MKEEKERIRFEFTLGKEGKTSDFIIMILASMFFVLIGVAMLRARLNEIKEYEEKGIKTEATITEIKTIKSSSGRGVKKRTVSTKYATIVYTVNGIDFIENDTRGVSGTEVENLREGDKIEIYVHKEDHHRFTGTESDFSGEIWVIAFGSLICIIAIIGLILHTYYSVNRIIRH